MGWAFPLFAPDFTWGDGPDTLPQNSPLRNDIYEYQPSGLCYRLKPGMTLVLIDCVQASSLAKPVLCYS